MSTTTEPLAPATPATPAAPTQAPVIVTERADAEVRSIIAQQRATDPSFPEKVYLRLRVVGGGCSGFQHKLDLDPQVNEKLDEIFEFHGIGVVIDKRSKVYLEGALVDF